MPSKILDGLYLGSIGTALSKEVMQELKITHILTAAGNLKPSWPKHFEYYCLPLLDTPTENIARHFKAVNTFIDEALAPNSETGKPS